MPQRPVLVVTGAGGMGLAIAQRLGPSKTILLADFSSEILEAASAQLKLCGHTEVHIKQTDVSDAASVGELAAAATSLGRVDIVVHTAGLGPTNNQAEKIYAVNLTGNALVTDAFQPVIASGGSMVCIASIAGHLLQLPPEEARRFALSPAGPDLLKSPLINLASDSADQAYATSKAVNILRVKASAKKFGERGVRINSISPGIVATPMGRAELSGVVGDQIKEMMEGQPIARIGAVDDIADAVAFLTGPGASWITGTDLIIDGGANAEQIRQTLLGEKQIFDIGNTDT